MKEITIFIFFFAYFNICISEDIKPKSKIETTKDDSSSNKELLETLGTPEALIRYRHDVPITIIKQKSQIIKRRPKPKIRRRVKQPKIKYGPSEYVNAEPLSHYKFIDIVRENHPSESSPFTSSSHFNEYENFYKELGPDFNFEDVTFSEYEKHPIEFDLYDEKSYRKYLLQQKFNQDKLSWREKLKKPNHWADVSTSQGLDNVETYDIPEESYWQHSSNHKNPLRKPTTDHKSSFIKDIQREKHKGIEQYHIPHTQYGVPLPIPDGELLLPKKKKQYHFGEPPGEIRLYEKPPYVENYLLKNNKKVKTTKTYIGNSNYKSPQNVKPPKYIQPPEDYNTYFTESTNYNNDFQQESHILSYQQELPLQNDAKFKYDFSKSSYDVPLYNHMPFRNDDQSNDNYPPLNDTYSISSESQSLPSKISVIYAETNATQTPSGYFAGSPSSVKNKTREKFTEKFRKNLFHQTRLNSKSNKTRRRKIKNQNSDHLQKITDLNMPYHENFLNESDQKFENTEKTGIINVVSSTKNIPLNLLLLSSANRNPGSHISSSKWDPMKVTSYHFKIDHENISASIPNIKVYGETKEKISTTTPTYKKRGKTRRNRNFGDAELNTTEIPYIQNVYTKKLPSEYFTRRTNGMIFNEHVSDSEIYEDEETTSEYETTVNSDHIVENDNININENLNNLKLIRDPFSFIYRNNTTTIESQTPRYKNHRYY